MPEHLTPEDRARQRKEWRKAVSAAKRAQRANRHRRKPARARAGMVRVQPRQEESRA